ncbi:MAG: exonuclease domain-containing protein [Hamadaea sp.]|uniref:3'-5' exonuclease n=1 Tax=Hamadaea sp. TaxID=2024425 RepID=UPI00183BB1F5|nr:3'-5' exonuclease [Hamadaea sp.]NUT18668.1 exonuclease domain-containing protein [Hamadaea sp.]
MEEAFGRFVNVVDVEATCWTGQPPPGETNEIIEIGVCVVDTADWRRTERHRIIVRPRRSRVSPFCTELTGLTQAEVDRGVDFATACAQLDGELLGRFRTWASWGDYDRHQFERQCGPGGAAYPFGSRHINIKQHFADAFGLRRGIGMSQALDKAGLPLEGRHHRGDDDAWNIGALVIELARLGHPITAATTTKADFTS